MFQNHKKVQILFGDKGYSLNIKSNWQPTVIRKPKMPLIQSSDKAVLDAFSSPINSPPLTNLAQEANSACILVCDITRPVPNGLFIENLVKNLIEANIKKEKILILIATGLHRLSSKKEIIQIINSKYVLENINIAIHNAKEDNNHRLIGITSKGNKISLDKRFLDAELKIVTGLVEPHFMAGFSGGRKVIAPGIAHEKTIRTFHSARYMEDPMAKNCNLKNNPLHEDQLEIIKMIGGAYAINCVIDEDRKLSYINFGEIIKSHICAVDFINSYVEVKTNSTFDTIVTSSAGAPLDSTFYQTVKGIVSPLTILNKGGDLIIFSECKEGIGSNDFKKSQRRLNADGKEKFILDILKKQYADIDEWQTQKEIEALKRANIYLYTTGISKEEQNLTAVNITKEPELVIEESIKRHNNNNIAIIPEGPYVVPRRI